MWLMAKWMARPMRIELTHEVLLAWLVNLYTTLGAPAIVM